MSTPKYKYYYKSNGAHVYRDEVIRETDFYFWLKHGGKISKKTNRFDSSSYQPVYLYDETTELLEQYKKTRVYHLYDKKIKELLLIDSIDGRIAILTKLGFEI